MSYHTAVPTTFNAPFKFFVAGGLSNDKTWQTFDGSTWSASAAIPVVTTSMASGCATYRDNSTIVLAGGTIGKYNILIVCTETEFRQSYINHENCSFYL